LYQHNLSDDGFSGVRTQRLDAGGALEMPAEAVRIDPQIDERTDDEIVPNKFLV
jgi:hypothetical protein